MRNIILLIIVVGVIGGVGYYFLSQKTEVVNEMPAMNQDEQMMMSSQPSMMMEGSDSANAEDGVKEFTVTGGDFKFDTSEIKVKVGDMVRINFKNAQGHHDFVIDEFDVATKQTNGPSEETVIFVASKAGMFEYYCSVIGHKQLGMKGRLIVE